MEFIRKPLWALFVLLALGCQETHTMEEKGINKECHILKIPLELQLSTLKEVFFKEKTDETNFRDIGINLSLVCKDWREIIKVNAKRWVCEYFNIDEKDKDIFWCVFKGKLIYNPDPNSDNGRVNLFISAFPNPLEGAFDLSQCGDTGNYLSISTGYRKKKIAENANKVEIWFAPRFLIEKELGTTAGHFKPIMDKWKQEQVGMLCTWGGNDNMDLYCYLTTENAVNLSKRNLYEHCQKMRCVVTLLVPGRVAERRRAISSFVCELK